jgi:branched-chain amino acid transport system permease protein
MIPVMLLHGLVYGMLIFLVASGLTLVLGMMDILNFTHASVYMIGAFICYQVISWTGSYWLALVVAPLFCALIGIVVERIFIRKVHASGHVNELLLTFGLALVFNEVIKSIYGTNALPVPMPGLLKGSIFLWSGLQYPIYRLFILVVSLVVLGVLLVLLRRTRLGIAIRAAVEDSQMTALLGTNVSLVFVTVMAVGSWLAGLAGVIVGPYLSVYSNMFNDMIMDCFVVVAVGGMGSLTGSFIAALIVGQIQSLGIIFAPRLSIVLIYLLMASVFVLRPQGLMGKKE